MNIHSKRLLKSAASLVFSLAALSQAHATFVAAICNDLACSGGDDIVIRDNGVGDSINSSGAISFATAVFGYDLAVDTAQSKPGIGSAKSPQLDLSFTATTNSAAPATLFLFASDTDFDASGSFLLGLGGTNSGGSGTETGRAWGGTNNDELVFSRANLFGSLGPLSGETVSSDQAGVFLSQLDPFSLTIGVAISRASAGTSTGDLNLQVSAVPEPESYALMLAGIGALGFVAKRRKVRS